MIKIKLAKNAGFCFGVSRAIKKVHELLDKNQKVLTLGPIIHNPQIINELEKKGVMVISTPSEVPKDAIMVVRSHGVSKGALEICDKLKINYIDMTCPFVAKIHKIVEEYSKKNHTVFIAGDENHPEVCGIKGHCSSNCYVFKNEEELKQKLILNKELKNKNIIMVSQTTFSKKSWEAMLDIAKNECTNIKIFDTICNATFSRQKEAEEIAKASDLMLVIGGKSSSNTNKLFNLCKFYCDTYLVETVDEIPMDKIKKDMSVGITAGASTPGVIIKEAINKLENTFTNPESQNSNPEIKGAKEMPEKNHIQDEVKTNEDSNFKNISFNTETSEEENFEQLLEESFKNLSSDKIIKGCVVNITPSEILVDIGRKQSGIIPINELSFESFEKPEDIVKIGDEVEVVITKTKDSEGVVILSKKRVDSAKSWDEIKNCFDNKSTLVCKVNQIIKGGAIASYKGTRVFIPASLAVENRSEKLEDLKDKQVTVKIIEFDRKRRRVVASRKAFLKEEKEKAKEKIWDTLKEGMRITGTVTGVTSYGAFVDLGGMDGLLHVSEMSWDKIKSPNDFTKVGDELQVYIKSLDKQKGKISLGHKDPSLDPWNIIERDYPVGCIVEVQITGLTSFGAFAQIIPGVEGLIHVSQISTKRIDKPQDAIKVGETVMAVITNVDVENHKVGLSIKKLLEDRAPKQEKKTPDYAEDLPENVSFSSEE